MSVILLLLIIIFLVENNKNNILLRKMKKQRLLEYCPEFTLDWIWTWDFRVFYLSTYSLLY